MSFDGATLALAGVAGLAVAAWSSGGVALGWFSFGGVALGWEGAMGGIVVAREFALGGIAQAVVANNDAAAAMMRENWFFVFPVYSRVLPAGLDLGGMVAVFAGGLAVLASEEREEGLKGGGFSDRLGETRVVGRGGGRIVWRLAWDR